MEKILIIEDDKWISDSLKLYLENSNFEIYLHYEWNEAINKINEIKPDLVILDINLPWKNGIDITKQLRETSNIPILMLTARSSEIDKINWLEIWADDYIAKPFSPRELLARIKTILRRSNDVKKDKESEIIEKDWVKINSIKKTVSYKNEENTLTLNEFNILKELFKKDWKILSRDFIMKEIIWYDQYVYDRTIDTHIKNLRKKIAKKDFILTLRWEWYRINV